MAFADNLKTLPGVSHLAALNLIDAADAVVATIEHKPGQAGSLAVYNHLAQLYGAISPEAAKKGLELYAEHTEDARTNPGKHPNIDRLIGLIERFESGRFASRDVLAVLVAGLRGGGWQGGPEALMTVEIGGGPVGAARAAAELLARAFHGAA